MCQEEEEKKNGDDQTERVEQDSSYDQLKSLSENLKIKPTKLEPKHVVGEDGKSQD